MESGFTVSPQVADARHHQRKQRRQQLLQIVAKKKVFLPRFSNDGRRIDRVAPMKDSIDMKDRILMLQGIVTIVITKWSFRSSFVRWRLTNQGKLRVCGQPMPTTKRILRQLDLFTGH